MAKDYQKAIEYAESSIQEDSNNIKGKISIAHFQPMR
jgi:hypothetical protein